MPRVQYIHANVCGFRWARYWRRSNGTHDARWNIYIGTYIDTQLIAIDTECVSITRCDRNWRRVPTERKVWTTQQAHIARVLRQLYLWEHFHTKSLTHMIVTIKRSFWPILGKLCVSHVRVNHVVTLFILGVAQANNWTIKCSSYRSSDLQNKQHLNLI